MITRFIHRINSPWLHSPAKWRSENENNSCIVIAPFLILTVYCGSFSQKLFVIIIALKAEPGSLRSANDVTEPVPWKTTDNDLMAIGTTQHDDLQQILPLGVDISMPPLSLSRSFRDDHQRRWAEQSGDREWEEIRSHRVHTAVLSSQSETKPQKIR